LIHFNAWKAWYTSSSLKPIMLEGKRVFFFSRWPGWGGVMPKKFLLGGSCEKIGKLEGGHSILHWHSPKSHQPPLSLKKWTVPYHISYSWRSYCSCWFILMHEKVDTLIEANNVGGEKGIFSIFWYFYPGGHEWEDQNRPNKLKTQWSCNGFINYIYM